MGGLQQAKIIDVCPTPYGHAVFVRADAKIFVIYMDRSRGMAVQSALDAYNSERPLTHEFILNLVDALDCKVKRVVIYHVSDGTFFTKIQVEMDNELGRKIVEVDGRPSDTFPMALRSGAPIYVSDSVVDSVADMSEAYRKIKGEE